MFKLSNFDTQTRAEEGVEFELKDHFTGEPTGAFVRVRGVDSLAYKKTMAERDRQLREILSSTGKPPTEEQRLAMTCDMLADLTVSWRGIVDEAGNEIEFSRAKAVELYKKYNLLRDAVDIACADRRAFLQA